MKRLVLGFVGLTSVWAVTSTMPLHAQTTAAQSQQIAMDAPEMAILVSARADSAIRTYLETARRTMADAQTAASAKDREYEIIRGRIEVRKREAETFKARIDLAKKENREAEKTQLELERETVNQHVRFLERLRDMYESEKRYEEARTNFARSEIALYEDELELAMTRAGDSSENIRMNPRFMDLQRDVLQAQAAVAERTQVMAQRQKDVFERRIRLLQAQLEWLARQT